MDAKKILIIDDHFEMLEFLRSMLDVAGQNYDVTSVPSGEEGWLELRLTKYDLLITDFRLPGISGFELAERCLKRFEQMPIIMITGNSTAQAREQARELGILYFEKPLDTASLLGAVQGLLNPDGLLETTPAGITPLSDDADLPESVQHRLTALLSETGADAILFASADGRRLYHAGEGAAALWDDSVAAFAPLLKHSIFLSELLGNADPATIQYHSGKTHELYGASIGHHYFMLALYPVQARRGRMATIWLFLQRTVNELSSLLAKAAEKQHKPISAPNLSVTRPLSIAAIKAAGHDEPAAVEKVSPSDALPELEPVSAEEARELLGFDLDASGVDASTLDDFWGEVEEDKQSASGSGFSIEEARKQGLLPPDFELDGG